MNSIVRSKGNLQRRVTAFLDGQSTLTLATISEDGTPYACDLFYVHTRDLTLYFLSDPKTQHVRNLLRAPRVSATIHRQSRGWEEIRGMQIVGEAGPIVPVTERASAFALYVIKYGFVKQWLTGVDRLGIPLEGLGTAEMYKIKPTWVRFTDNSLGFGHKDEMTLH